MKHARFRRTAASLAAAAVALGGLVAINAASSSAAVPTSGDRIVHWDVEGTDFSQTQVRMPDIMAPAGQRFTEVFPALDRSTVVALTSQNRVFISGDAFPELPAGLLDGPVLDLASSDGRFAAVLSSGEIVSWSQQGLVQVPADLCDATLVGVDTTGFAAVCEDGSVEVSSPLPALLDVPEELADVQQIALAGGAAVALDAEGRAFGWGATQGVSYSEQIPETVGKDIAVVSIQHAITTDGDLISYDRGGRNQHFLPADDGGVDPAIVAEGVTSVAGTIGAAFLTTREGSYASWGQSALPWRAIRPAPADLADARFVDVNVNYTHVAAIVADTDGPTGPALVTESSVTGAETDGTAVPGTTLTGVPATFDPAPETVTTDWLVDGQAVPASSGATTFAVTTAMIGKDITFRTRASGGTLTEAIDSVTEPISVLAPVGRRVVTASSISGIPVENTFLGGTPATYDSTPTTVSTRWYVDGVEDIDARNLPEYLVPASAVGKKVTFETRASWAGDPAGTPAYTSRVESDTVRVAIVTATETVIEGDAVVGSEVKVVTPATFNDTSDDVIIEGEWLLDYVEPVGTGDTYTLKASDIGRTLVHVTTAYRFPLEKENFLAAYSYSNPVGPITAAPLAITGTPVITGDPYIGEEISVAPAPVNDPEAEVTLTWKVGGESTGVTGTTYTPTEADAGKTITVEQVASRGGATEAGPDYASAESAPTAAVSERPADLAVESAATLTGTAIEGETLTGTPATFSPTENVTVDNFWVIGGTETPATGTTLVLTADHVGQNIQFKSVATRGQDTLSSTSTTVGPVLAKLAVTTAASVSGTPEVGKTLTATPAVFTTTEGVTVTNRWLADGAPIEGATSLNLLLTDAQLGAAITFESTALRGAEPPVVSESAPTAEVIRTPITVTTAATVAGEARVGQTLTGTPAVFSITDGVTVSNRWLANGAPIEGATGTTLELTEALLGQTITFESSAMRGDETPVVSASGPVGPVLPAAVDPEEPGEVTIDLDGPTAPGATITVNVGTALAGQQVQVYLSNLERLLAPATVAADGTIQVVVPGDIPLGTHRLAVYAGGALVGFDDFTVTIVRPEDPAFKDKVSVDPKEVRAGQQVTVTVGADRAGQSVRVVVFSTARDLGFATVAADGTVKVTIPADLAAGVHRLAVYDANGALIGYQDFTVLADQAGGGRNGVLPSTGAGDVGPMIPLGLTFLLAGLGLLLFRSRGRTRLG